MNGAARDSGTTHHPVNTITLVRRPDRRQIPTRRAHFRGGRRAEDRAEEVQTGNKASSKTEEGARGPESAIVMGWEFLPDALRKAVGSY
jgi:hypothetical protein